MQKKKLFALAGVTLLATTILAACGGANSSKGSSEEAPSVYSYVYSGDPETLNYVMANKASTSDITSNLIDGLLENDEYGNLVPSIAEDWTVSEDGLTYTYKLREGAKWFTADGEEYADVTANDFVFGLKYAADNKSEGLYIVKDSIAGLAEYVDGAETDFSKVGIKAVDDYTLEYTLKKAEPFWNSKTTMNILFPLNEEFTTSQGDAFGTPTDPATLLYNGPYLLSAITAKSSVEFAKNEAYWDADNVSIEEVKLTYYDGSDPESLVKGFEEANYSVARVFPNGSNFSSVQEKYGDNITYSLQGSTTFYAQFNLDRQNYDSTSKTTDEEKAATKAALKNKDFRQAISFAFNREDYSAQNVGKDGATKNLRTMLVPSDFVTIGESTFADVVEKEIVSYGSEWENVQLDDAQDGVFNEEKAKAEFDKAKKALEAEGVKFPIHLDVPMDETYSIGVSQAQSFKQSLESVLGEDNVVVDIQLMDQDSYYNGGYYAANASQLNYDINISSGWGPDFQDPSTYLDIFDATMEGSHTYTIGLDGGSDNPVIKELGFDEYSKLLEEASNETTDVSKRYELYAKAQAWLQDSAVVVPFYSSGATPGIRRTAPFTAAYGTVGNKRDTYKLLDLQAEPVTTKDYEAAREKWLKERAESNAKAQEALADHVK